MNDQPIAACQHGRYSIDTETQRGRCVLCGAEGRMEFVVPSPRAGDGNVKPLPCPFCGSNEGLSFDDGSTYRWGLASCIGCGATAGEVRRSYQNGDAWHADAIEEWNTRAALAAAPTAAPAWQLIETAPKDGRALLLGHFNSAGRWRTVRGEWMSQEFIDEYWEEPDNGEPGWYETSVESDDVPNCWRTHPTHWMPLPAAPSFQAPAAAPAVDVERDAARYRHLRNQSFAPGAAAVHGSVWVVKRYAPKGAIPDLQSAGFGADLDASVDAAMAAAPSFQAPATGEAHG